MKPEKTAVLTSFPVFPTDLATSPFAGRSRLRCGAGGGLFRGLRRLEDRRSTKPRLPEGLAPSEAKCLVNIRHPESAVRAKGPAVCKPEKGHCLGTLKLAASMPLWQQ